MSRSRRYGEDLTYPEEHRGMLPQFYGRIGHRIDMADRDWTEFCHYCKKPLAIYETVRDVGQDLFDKGVSVTRQLADKSEIPALLLAWQIERPKHVQDEIDALNKHIRQLECMSPISGFKVRKLSPVLERKLRPLTPDEWWLWLMILHRNHHQGCRKANEYPVRVPRLLAALEEHPLYTPTLFGDEQLWWSA